MKINGKRKLIPAIAMLAVSAIVLSSASYAWFTMSRTVTADGITLTAVAPTNLLISNAADGTYAEKTTITANYDYKLIPASSGDGKAFYAPTSIKAADAGAPTATTKFTDVSANPITNNSSAEATDGKDGYYADFKLWLKTDGDTAVDVTVSTLLSKVSNVETGKLADAVRFSILDKDGAILADSANVYNVGETRYFTGLTGPLVAACLTPETDSFKGAALGEGVANNAEKLFTCAADNTATPITVRVWIEGQDKDCITPEAKNPQFSVTLGFKDVLFSEA